MTHFVKSEDDVAKSILDSLLFSKKVVFEQYTIMNGEPF